jgi:hypothetical protein
MLLRAHCAVTSPAFAVEAAAFVVIRAVAKGSTDVRTAEPRKRRFDVGARARLGGSGFAQCRIDEQHRSVDGQMRRVGPSALKRSGALSVPTFSRNEKRDGEDVFSLPMSAFPEQIAEDVACISRFEDALHFERIGRDVQQRLQLGNCKRRDPMRLEFLQQFDFIGELRTNQDATIRFEFVAKLRDFRGVRLSYYGFRSAQPS